MAIRGSIRPARPYKGYKDLERLSGGPRGRYLRLLHEALEGLIRPLRAL